MLFLGLFPKAKSTPQIWTVRIEKDDNIPFIQILLEVYKCITESVKHHIHFTGHGSQAKCSEQSLADPTPKARDRPS